MKLTPEQCRAAAQMMIALGMVKPPPARKLDGPTAEDLRIKARKLKARREAEARNKRARRKLESPMPRP